MRCPSKCLARNILVVRYSSRRKSGSSTRMRCRCSCCSKSSSSSPLDCNKNSFRRTNSRKTLSLGSLRSRCSREHPAFRVRHDRARRRGPVAMTTARPASAPGAHELPGSDHVAGDHRHHVDVKPFVLAALFVDGNYTRHGVTDIVWASAGGQASAMKSSMRAKARTDCIRR